MTAPQLKVAARDPAFEAYNGLCLAMPNGKTVTGKVILWPDGLELLELLQLYQATGLQKQFRTLWARFLAVTGIPEAEFTGLTIGELCGVIERFLSHRRTPSIPQSPSSLAEPAAGSPPSPSAGG